MKKLAIIALSLTLYFISFNSYSQDSKMEVFVDLVGNWKGKALSQTPDGRSSVGQ